MDISIYYQPIYLIIISIVTIIYSYKCISLNYGDNMSLDYQNDDNYTNLSSRFMIIFLLVFVVIIGLRPEYGKEFGDTGTYSTIYKGFVKAKAPIIGSEDWLFYFLMYFFANSKVDISVFYILVAGSYVFCMFFACKKLLPYMSDYAMLFCLGAFSFFSYCVNGIRSGLACSLAILALSFIIDKNIRGYFIATILAFLAYFIHHSTILPILCAVIAVLYNRPKWIFIFWLFSILLSLIAGDTLTDMFASWGFDDRLQHYLREVDYNGQFSRVGFRWDFLLYSAMPIWLGYVVLIKNGIRDQTYQLLLSTYMLSNSFWIMIIRAPFSNRFAYLSWFLYPLVIAYPILSINIWEQEQGRYVSRILLAHTGFTLFMFFIYH